MILIIKSTLRRILKDRINLLINLFGLTTGMLAFVFILSWIISENSYDQFWQNVENLYRVELRLSSQDKILENTAKNYNGVAPVLRNNMPEIESATHISKDIITVFTPEASVQNINMFFTDSMFFKVFPRPLECENAKLLFNDIHNAAISRSLAKKLFGNTNPINQTFKLNEGWEFYVKAVFDDIPENSHIKCDLVLMKKALFYYMRNFDYATGKLDYSNIDSIKERDPYQQNQWNSKNGYTYIRFNKNFNIEQVKKKYADIINPCIQHIIKNGESVHFDFTPVKNIYLHSNKMNEIQVNGSYSKIVAFTIIGLLILVTSILNFINISVASSINNTKAEGLHNILGANKLNISTGHITKSLFFNVISGLITFLVSVIFITNGTNVAGFKIFPLSSFHLSIICLLLIITSTLISLVYPFLFSSFDISKTQNHLKDKIKGRSPNSIKTLVVFQFCISIFLIICTITIFRQLWFMQNSDIGMNIEQTIVSFSPMTMIKKPDEKKKLETFRNEVQKIPGVIKFTTAEIKAGDDFKRSTNDVHILNQEKNKSPFSTAQIDYDYFKFFSIRLICGKSFSQENQLNGNEVILNEMACQKLGLSSESAINKFIVTGNRSNRIIGVVNNYHHQSLKDAIKPIIFYNSTNWYHSVGYYYIKISSDNMQQTITQVKNLWNKLYPEEEYHFSLLDETFNNTYKADKNFGNIFLLLAILNIMIASLGLLALAIFASKARIKEIGIRKVNGAKISEVMILLNKDFIKWVAIAFVIATPAAYYSMSKWLENFAYKTSLSWLIFALAGLMTLCIAILTVCWQSWKAASSNPVKALRYE